MLYFAIQCRWCMLYGYIVRVEELRLLFSDLKSSFKYSNLAAVITIVGCRVNVNNTSIVILLVYIPPSCKLNDYHDMFEAFGTCDVLYGKNVLVLGDFNKTHFNNQTGSNDHKICNFMEIHSFQQHNIISNGNEKFLDLVFSNFDPVFKRAECPMISEDVHHPVLEVYLSTDQEKHKK